MHRAAIHASTALLVLGSPVRAQTTVRVSVGPAGAQANAYSSVPSVSADGRFVAFHSLADNLVPGDTNGQATDVFVRDRISGTTTRVSESTSGAQGNGGSYASAMSADGRFVCFYSIADNLVPGDTNAHYDVFVRDRLTLVTARVSVSSPGVQGNHDSTVASISDDGRLVVFSSNASNLDIPDTNSVPDVFVHDLVSGVTRCVSVDPLGAQANGRSDFTAISADGRYVAFESAASNLVPGDTAGVWDIFVRDLFTSTTQRVSVSSSGIQANATAYSPSISADGRFVAFHSEASNLVAGDTNAASDVFVHDRQTGTTIRASVSSSGAEAHGSSSSPSLSPDGRYLAFLSSATDLIPFDTNNVTDVFLRDLQTGETTRAGLSYWGGEVTSVSVFGRPVLSLDALDVVFANASSQFVPQDTNVALDVFVRDRRLTTGTSFCVGDGADGPCPCGARGALGAGCPNSTYAGGAGLSATGTPSVSADTVVLVAHGLTGSLAVFFQGATSLPPSAIDDGIGCVGGPIVRLGNKPATTTSSYPQSGDAAISVRGAIPPLGGSFYYQCFYRNAATAFCPPATSNRTNGFVIVWMP